MKHTTRLRALLAQPQILIAPGAADALTARLIQEAGFAAVYATGAGIANTQFALPDIGLVSSTEMLQQIQRIVNAAPVPVLADADTGYGNPLNVMRTVREYEHAGVAGIQLEDQVSPKKCGHFDGKEVIPAEEMAQKLRAAVAARQDPDLVLVARTDALAIHGFEQALARARLYAENGADVIFLEALRTRDQIERAPREVPCPLLFNLTEGAKSPLLTADELQDLGYRIVIYPNTAMRVAIHAVQHALATLHAERSSQALVPHMVNWDERQRIVRLPEYQQLDQQFGRAPARSPIADVGDGN